MTVEDWVSLQTRKWLGQGLLWGPSWRNKPPPPHYKVLKASGIEQEPGRQISPSRPLPVEQPLELHPTPSVTHGPKCRIQNNRRLSRAKTCESALASVSHNNNWIPGLCVCVRERETRKEGKKSWPRESCPGQDADGPWGGGEGVPSMSFSCLPWGTESLGQRNSGE